MANKSKILVTGGAGFIGSAFVRQIASKTNKIIVVDSLTYAGDKERLRAVEKNIKFYKTNIANLSALKKVFQKEKPTQVIHFAAETHVDRSIISNHAFISSNVTGTQNLIDLSRQYKIKKFIHISTDEVYGESKSGKFIETDPIKAQNPYAATKAAAEFLVRGAMNTFKFPAIIVRPANNYGPWQYPEKLIPVVVLKALNNQKVPVYGKGLQVREWLHVEDCARGVRTILRKGKIGETYNIGSYYENKNINTVKTILKLLGKSDQLIKFVKDRPGHDFRYSVSYAKLKKLGWKPKVTFQQGIRETVQWYLNHTSWTTRKLTRLQQYWKKVYR